MSDRDPSQPPARGAGGSGARRPLTAERRLAGLLRDLATLQAYLEERGRHTYELAQRFTENARRDPAARTYDERQATMLEYQHYIWHEIAGRVNQLRVGYGGDDASPASPASPIERAAPSADAGHAHGEEAH